MTTGYITIAQFGNTAAALDKPWAAGVAASGAALPALRRNVETGIERLNALNTDNDTLAGQIRALRGNGAGILKLCDKIGADIKTWLTAYNVLIDSVRKDIRFEYIRQRQESVALAMRPQELLQQLNNTALSLINEAKAISGDAKIQSNNINQFVSQVKDAENKATGGGVLNKVMEVASLPGKVVGGTVSNIVNPISGTLKWVAIATLVGAAAVLWLTSGGAAQAVTGVFKKKSPAPEVPTSG